MRKTRLQIKESTINKVLNQYGVTALDLKPIFRVLFKTLNIKMTVYSKERLGRHKDYFWRLMSENQNERDPNLYDLVTFFNYVKEDLKLTTYSPEEHLKLAIENLKIRALNPIARYKAMEFEIEELNSQITDLKNQIKQLKENESESSQEDREQALASVQEGEG